MTESPQNGTFRSARGGRRPGAGRPPAYSEPLVRKTVTLPVSYVAQLTRFGVGNLSDGIRLLVETAYTRNGTPWFDPPRSAPSGTATSSQTRSHSGRGYAAWLAPGLDNPRRPTGPLGLTTSPRRPLLRREPPDQHLTNLFTAASMGNSLNIGGGIT
jgi:hypothetical protein